MSLPQLGEKFPEMKVQTTQGTKVLPGDYKGKWFVLFSHPADFTPVCTTEFMAFEKRRAEFEKHNTELIGLSVDQIFSHIKWVQWIKEEQGVEIGFPVIADDLGKISQKLGMLHPEKGANTVRAVFIVDDKGIIRLMLYYPQEAGRNIDEILRVVKALQYSSENGVAMPANWPENDVLADRVIIPPAENEDEARKRLEAASDGEIGCFDWWFCHKEKQ